MSATVTDRASAPDERHGTAAFAVTGAAVRKRAPAGAAAGVTAAASTVIAIASGPMRVYLNSAIAARGSLSSAWKRASIACASAARPSRCRAWNAP